MTKDKNIFVHHVRPNGDKGCNKPIGTFVARLNTDGDKPSFSVGASCAAPEDNFEKKVGVRIATERTKSKELNIPKRLKSHYQEFEHMAADYFNI